MSDHLVHRPGIAATGSIVQRQVLEFRRLWIDQPTLILVEAGDKTLRGAAGSFRIGSGEAVALAGGQAFDVSNHLGAGECYRARWLSFERALLADAARPAPAAGRKARPVVVLGAMPSQFGVAFAGLTQTLADKSLPDAIAAHRAREMLVWIEAAGGQLLLDDGELFAPRVRRLLARDPAGELRSPQVASELALSEASLRRRLAAEGTSLSEIQLDVRMSSALTLLQSTPWQVTRIAADVGYQSPSQFARRFRQRFGFSPSAIRRSTAAGAPLP